MKTLSFLFVVLLSSFAFASWSEDFELLRNIPRSYEDAGSICEEVARLQMQRQYREPQYKIIVGIAYGNSARVIGELDIVILDNNLQKVIKIGEVKCWKDMRGGLKKAHEQRDRFRKTIRVSDAQSLRFFSTSTRQSFSADQFQYVNEFFSVGPKGSRAAGYDVEMEYSLQEMHNYRMEMIRCQSKNLCARP